MIRRSVTFLLRGARIGVASINLLLLCSVSLAEPRAKAPLPAVYSLAFSLDGKKLAVGTHKEALLYETGTWTVSDTITSVQNAVRALTFHPDGKLLAVGSGINGSSGNLLMWDPAKPTEVKNYTPAKDTIESIAFSKDGTSMLTASFDNKARFYAWTYYRYGEQKLEEHNDRVTAVAFSSKPKTIFITGSMDKMVKVWDFKSTKVVVNFDQATAGITGLAFLSNGDQFVGSSMDGNLYWWGVGYDERKKIYSGYPFRTIRAHEGGVTAFSASANQQRMITGGMDHIVRVWKLDDGGLVREFKEPAAPIFCTALSPDGKIAAAAGREGIIWVWDVEANKLLTTLTPPRPKPANSLAAAPQPATPTKAAIVTPQPAKAQTATSQPPKAQPGTPSPAKTRAETSSQGKAPTSAPKTTKTPSAKPQPAKSQPSKSSKP